MLHDITQLICQLTGLDPVMYGLWITLLLRITLVATCFLGGISVLAMFLIWLERKVAGHMQSRLGPTHVGGRFGWAQSIADGIKLILKEDLRPTGADVLLFRLAPYLAFAPVFAALLILPFGPQFVFESGLNIGVLYLLAVLGVEVMGVILAGWASASKWSLYGAMREACQMVSYEVPLGLAIITGVLTAGTLHLSELSFLQGGGLHDWFVFHNPFMFVAFMVYFVASLASNKRAPFDLPESESELVAGFHTEYSGMRFSFFFFAEYAGMFIIGAIQAALFLGGWNSPLGGLDPVYQLLGYEPVTAGVAYISGVVTAESSWNGTATAMGMNGLTLFLLNLYCLVWFVLKALVIVFVQIWLRWTLPRIRIDQVLHVCVKVLLPISLVCLVGTAVWIWLVPQALPVEISGQSIARLGHLYSPTPMFQLLTQIVLALVGMGLVGAYLGVVAWALLSWRGKGRPRQTFFPDVMPAGNQVAFTKNS
ncbi:MAG: NADH-quinone oxidoreductase subunit NuoH [Phycisphaerales bacterium]|nr:NADH-quinone oxidoreductase subunit NuoH [Phycisphaerales bacterium]